jgi:hypothetical protein
MTGGMLSFPPNRGDHFYLNSLPAKSRSALSVFYFEFLAAKSPPKAKPALRHRARLARKGK